MGVCAVESEGKSNDNSNSNSNGNSNSNSNSNSNGKIFDAKDAEEKREGREVEQATATANAGLLRE